MQLPTPVPGLYCSAFVLVVEDTTRVMSAPANGTYFAVPPGGGATYHSASLFKIYKDIQRDQLERCWRRDADKVLSLQISLPF